MDAHRDVTHYDLLIGADLKNMNLYKDANDTSGVGDKTAPSPPSSIRQTYPILGFLLQALEDIDVTIVVVANQLLEIFVQSFTR